MNESCAKAREWLIDARGGAEGMPDGVSGHLLACGECRAFQVLIKSLCGQATPASPLDFSIVERALAEASHIEKRRRDVRQFFAFLTVACFVAFGFAFACASGFAMQVLAAQAAGFIVLTGAGLFAIKRRLKGEYEWTT